MEHVEETKTMETNDKKTDWDDVVRKMAADKARIEAHYDDPDSADISDIQFTKPLTNLDGAKEIDWDDVVTKVAADKARIRQHFADPDSVDISDIKFIQPIPAYPETSQDDPEKDAPSGL